MRSKTFLEEWAERPVDYRDRMFYLAALPITVIVVGLIPHLLQMIFISGAPLGLLKLSFQVIVGALLIGIICYAMTRWLSRPRWWGPMRSRWPLVKHLLLLWIPAAMLVDAPLRLAELSMLGPLKSVGHVAPYILGVSMGRTFLFAGGIVFYERLLGAVMEAADNRQRTIRLEAQTLKNLIQPHFMLNSLNAIRANIEEAPKVAEEILLNLTSILRKVIDYSSKDKIALQDELRLVEEYIALMNRRFEQNVKLIIGGASDISLMIPPLILFNLVENSFKHGFANRDEGEIRITFEASDRIRIVINDNGVPSGETETSGGAGGQYVQNRLELNFGDDFTFTHGRKSDQRYEAVIEIPWKAV